MKRITLIAECLVVNANKKGSNATFIVKADKQPAAQPGQPDRIIARQTAVINFDDGTAKQFEPGNKYKISIEE